MKRFLLFFLGIVVLLIVAVTIFLLTFDLNSYRRIITEKASVAIGRPVKIGDLSMKLSMIPTITARDIEIANPDRMASDGALLKVDTLDATLKIAPLFSRRIEVQSVALGTVDVNLLRKGGCNNWTFERANNRQAAVPTPDAPDTTNEWLSQMRVDNISAETIRLSYRDDKGEKKTTLSDLSVKQLKVFSVIANWNDISFKISGTLNNLVDLLLKKPEYLYNIELAGAGMNIKVSGNIGNTQTFKNLVFKVELSGNSLKQTLDQFGFSSRSIPAQAFNGTVLLQGDMANMQLEQCLFALGNNKLQADFKGNLENLTSDMKASLMGTVVLSDEQMGEFWGIRPFSAESRFVLTPGRLSLDELVIMANRSDIQLSGTVVLTDGKPVLDMRLNSEYLDLQDVLQQDDVGYVPTTPRGYRKTVIIPDNPIRLDALRNVDATISFLLPHIKPSETFSDYVGVGGRMMLKNGYLNIKPLKIEIFDGNIDGSVQVQSGTAVSDFQANLTGQNLQLDRIKSIREFVKGSSIDFAIDLKASGNSVKTLLSTLTGRVSAEIPQGTIIDEWFNKLADSLGLMKHSVTFSTTDLESKILCGAMNLNIKNGQIQGDNILAVETSTVNFMVGGALNLATEALDLNMIPSVDTSVKTADNLLKMVGRFIKITGTFADRRWDIDKLSALKGVVELLQNQSQRNQSYQLCQQVLGRQPQGQARLQSRRKQMLLPKPTQKSEPVEQKPETFQKQLMDTVSKVLQ